MTFEEKLKQLRKNKNITQDELAKNLFVSRTAVSKWESGNGYPSIDTLKLLAKFYDVSIDELVSNEEILDISKNNIEKNKKQTIDFIFCIIDILVSILLLFLPIYGLDMGDRVASVVLFSSSYTTVKLALILVLIFANLLFGLLIIPFVWFEKQNILKYSRFISFGLNGLLVACFLVSKEPYAGVVALGFLAIKILLILKK